MATTERREQELATRLADAAPELLEALNDLRTAVGRMPLAMITEHVPPELADRVNGLLGRLCPPRITGVR